MITLKEVKPWAIICDIDGTLALRGDRGIYEWEKVGEDTLNEPIAKLVNYVANRYEVLYVSGRNDVCVNQTRLWLYEHSMALGRLFMRKDGDMRKDCIVKSEIYTNHIADHYNIAYVLDDRNQVVEMWRSLGLTCLQVADGNF